MDDVLKVRLLAVAREQTEFVALTANSFRGSFLDAQQFQVGVHSGLYRDAGRGGLFRSLILRKDEPLGLSREASLKEQLSPLQQIVMPDPLPNLLAVLLVTQPVAANQIGTCRGRTKAPLPTLLANIHPHYRYTKISHRTFP